MPKIPTHLTNTSTNIPLKASRIASNAVPVKRTIKGTLKPKDDGERCIACSGTGKASNGSRCFACGGKGTKYTWICPHCNARHDGFSNTVCRNEKCPSHRLKGKKS